LDSESHGRAGKSPNKEQKEAAIMAGRRAVNVNVNVNVPVHVIDDIDEDVEDDDDGPSVASEGDNNDNHGADTGTDEDVDGYVDFHVDDETVVDEEGWPDWWQPRQEHPHDRWVGTTADAESWYADEERRQAEDPIEQEFASLLAFHHDAARRSGRPQRPVEELSAWMEERPRLGHLALSASRASPPPSEHTHCHPDRRGWLLLHYAAHVGFKAEVIRGVATKWPHMLRHPSDSGQLPHHTMILPIEETRVLVQLHPEALRCKDRRGDLPLHCVMGVSIKHPVFRYLAEQYPQSLQEPSGDGILPVHRLADCAGTPAQRIDTIQSCVRLWPGALEAADASSGRTLLSWAADSGRQCSEVVSYLAEAGPRALHIRDREGWLPLHVALAQSLDTYIPVRHWVDGARRIVELYPEAARERYPNGELPLHRAALLNADAMPLLKLLVETYPESVRCASDDGSLPLHRAAKAGRPDAARFLAREWPESVLLADAEGRTPLHIASGHSESGPHLADDPATVRVLVDEGPEAAQVRSKDGQLPLHGAARSARLETVRLLIDACPTSVQATTVAGCTPLHCAADAVDTDCDNGPGFWQKERKAVLERLARHWPEALRTPCSILGFLPLHYAARSMRSLPSLRSLVALWPEAVVEPSLDGSLPIHLAVARDVPRLRVVRHLARRHPESLTFATCDGSLPLHLALAQKEPSLKVVRFLVEEAPEALQVANVAGSLPLHIAAAASKSSKSSSSSSHTDASLVKICADLVETYPQALQAPDKSNGMLPFQIAAASDAPLDVVFCLLSKWPAGIARREEGLCAKVKGGAVVEEEEQLPPRKKPKRESARS
jgi:ankyrin repeat protein